MPLEVRSMYRTALKSTPILLVFGSDIILNTPFISDQEAIRKHEQQFIDKNNKYENKNYKVHSYKVHEKVVAHS